MSSVLDNLYACVQGRVKFLPVSGHETLRNIEALIISSVIWISVTVFWRSSIVGQNILWGETVAYALAMVGPGFLSTKFQVYYYPAGIIYDLYRINKYVLAMMFPRSRPSIPYSHISAVMFPSPQQPTEQAPRDCVTVRVNQDTYTITPVLVQVQLCEIRQSN